MDAIRIGVCITINNQSGGSSTSRDTSHDTGSCTDVLSLKTAYETVGFDVHSYQGCERDVSRVQHNKWLLQILEYF